MVNNVKKLLVKYNGNDVGYLVDIDDKIAFQYSESWIKNGFSISPLSLPLLKKTFISKNEYLEGLFGVFYDSLPDGWGNLLIKRKMAQKGIDYDKLSPLTKLSLLSEKSLGGLSYEPIQYSEDNNDEYDLDKLAKDAEKLFNSENANIDLDTFFRLGGSSGGSRPKVHIKDQNEEWIVKFPCSYDPKDIGIQEYRANLLAKSCTINVNECKLFDSKLNKGYFGAKRFDRKGDRRVHMISLSSILETTHRIPNLDYSHLFQIVSRICVDKEDIYEAYRRMCFNILYGNKDDHGKNFAFIYNEEKKGYELSPFYDITKTPYKAEHEMTVNGNGNPTEEDLILICKEFKLSLEKCEEIIDNIKKILNN